MKPSATSRSAARRVLIGSGARVRGSGVTSSSTSSVPVAARPRRARRTVSPASTAPEVLGSRCVPAGTWSSTSPLLPSAWPSRSRSTRRRATVTSSAAEASRAARMTSKERNFPVPTRSRLVSVGAPTCQGSTEGRTGAGPPGTAAPVSTGTAGADVGGVIWDSPRGHDPDRVLRSPTVAARAARSASQPASAGSPVWTPAPYDADQHRPAPTWRWSRPGPTEAPPETAACRSPPTDEHFRNVRLLLPLLSHQPHLRTVAKALLAPTTTWGSST